MVQSFPPGFRTEDIETGGATIHVRFGGSGPAVVMLHGWPWTLPFQALEIGTRS